jgi:hypothetical protein
MKSSLELQYVSKDIEHIHISAIDEVEHEKENNNPSTVFQKKAISHTIPFITNGMGLIPLITILICNTLRVDFMD